MESGFYRLMQEEARQSVEAEIEETRTKAIAEIEEIRTKAIAEAEEIRTKVLQQVTHEATIKSILAILDARFQSILVQCLKPAIEQIDDLQQIRQLLLQAVSAPSLEAFAETLVQNGNN